MGDMMRFDSEKIPLVIGWAGPLGKEATVIQKRDDAGLEEEIKIHEEIRDIVREEQTC